MSAAVREMQGLWVLLENTREGFWEGFALVCSKKKNKCVNYLIY